MQRGENDNLSQSPPNTPSLASRIAPILVGVDWGVLPAETRRQCEQVAKELAAFDGNSLKFSSGCWLSLSNDNGMLWGECPYGQVWGCNAQGDFVSAILNWLAYWNEPRTETGALIEGPDNQEEIGYHEAECGSY